MLWIIVNLPVPRVWSWCSLVRSHPGPQILFQWIGLFDGEISFHRHTFSTDVLLDSCGKESYIQVAHKLPMDKIHVLDWRTREVHVILSNSGLMFITLAVVVVEAFIGAKKWLFSLGLFTCCFLSTWFCEFDVPATSGVTFTRLLVCYSIRIFYLPPYCLMVPMFQNISVLKMENIYNRLSGNLHESC